MRERAAASEERLLFPTEPSISVGLLTDVERADFTLEGEFRTPEGKAFPPGEYRAIPRLHPAGLEIRDAQQRLVEIAPTLVLIPANPATTAFALCDVPVGKGFHWERREAHRYAGTLAIRLSPSAPDAAPRLMVINALPVETYLASVVASEMSAHAPWEFLKAHAIISRSWLLANLTRRIEDVASAPSPEPRETATGEIEILHWTDRTTHREFDVCADDHCQRYYGLAPLGTSDVVRAVMETRGWVLLFHGQIGDARFSKCCGGATEEYRSAWEDRDVPYLRGGRFDGAEWPPNFPRPLTVEAHAVTWITGTPPAYCHTTDARALEGALPEVDRPTRDFFRWEHTISQEELQALLQARLGLDLGAIRRLEPLQRGSSGRLVRLRIVGERERVILGKELMIRRALSRTHLYSSAFVIFPEDIRAGVPRRFRLRGAGWGHGVGLCQIGAAVMARQGRTCQQILAHYYAPAHIARAYE
ncbi:hypothetical protein HRbin08_00611 [bacterium HR08]|nr:hypothetical protein HRbin08_00611 [bacterium HR08]